VVKRTQSKRSAAQFAGLDGATDKGPAIRQRPVLAADRVTVLREAQVEPADWIDPDDSNPIRREARRVSGVRVVDALSQMHKRSGLVSKRHLKAARAWAADYEFGPAGARPGAERGMTGSAPSGFGPAQYPEEARVQRVSRYNAACATLGETGTLILHHVVLGIPDPNRRDVASLARRLHWRQEIVQGYLLAALDRLADFYVPKPGPGQ
jgi:hypothetical protein